MSEISSGLVVSIYLAFSDDGENIRFWTSNAFRAVEWAQENWETEAFVRLSDAEAKLSECVTSYEKEVAGLTEELDAKDAEIEAARRSSDYWKANHLAGNQVIEKQSAALKLAREALFDMQDSYAAVHGWKDSFVIAATTAIAAIDSLQKGE